MCLRITIFVITSKHLLTRHVDLITKYTQTHVPWEYSTFYYIYLFMVFFFKHFFCAATKSHLIAYVRIIRKIYKRTNAVLYHVKIRSSTKPNRRCSRIECEKKKLKVSLFLLALARNHVMIENGGILHYD